jgi:hypothetical protein
MKSVSRTPVRVGARSRGSRGPSDSRSHLVYRHIPHQPNQLVFAPEERAHFVHQIWTAINQAKSWRQFANLLPAGEWERVVSRMETRPSLRAPFDSELLPGFSDGDYPPWIQQEAGRYLPAITLEEFGICGLSSINGIYWQIPGEIEVPLVDRLKQLGFTVTLREDWTFW